MILYGTQMIEDRPYRVYICKGMHQINKITMSKDKFILRNGDAAAHYEDKFEWTNELVKEFFVWYSSIYANPHPTDQSLDAFKRLKLNSK